MSNAVRTCSWGYWGIGLWEGDIYNRPTNEDPESRKRAVQVAWLPFGVGAQGSVDGMLGSPERGHYQAICRYWVSLGILPVGAEAR
jgi:hypothetical protein